MVAALWLVAGCSGGAKGSLSGTVTVKGKPLPAGTITVKCADGTLVAGMAKEGRYKVDGISRGTLKVCVAPADPTERVFDPKALRDTKNVGKERADREAKEIAKKMKEGGMVIDENYQDIDRTPLAWDTSKGWEYNIEIP
jgi:hypothetical protein